MNMENGNFIEYPEGVLDDETEAELYKLKAYTHPYHVRIEDNKRNKQGKDIVDFTQLIGDPNKNVLDWLYDLKTNDVVTISFYISEAIRQNLITKEEANELLRNKQKEDMIIPPPLNITDDENEWINLYIELKDEYHKDDFARIEFDADMFLNSNIMDIVEQRAFLLDADDVLDDSEKSINNFEIQRSLLIKVFENLNQTKRLENFIKNTNKKNRALNTFMDDKTKFGLISGNSDEVFKDYVEKINKYDFENSKDDRVEFLRISSHIFNMYTKLIENNEKTIMLKYVENGINNKGDDKSTEAFKSALEAELINFKEINKKYKEIRIGKYNSISKPSFTNMVMEYYKYKRGKLNEVGISWRDSSSDDNFKYGYKEFIKDKYGIENDFDIGAFEEFYSSLDDVIGNLDSYKLLVPREEFLHSFTRFIERSEKFYDIKHINVMQLYEYNEDMLVFNALDKNNKKNMIMLFDNFGELFSFHYTPVDPENNIIDNCIDVGKRFVNYFESKLGKMNLPLPQLTTEQKERFLKLSKYLQDLEENRVSSNYGLEPEVCEKLQNLYDSRDKNENDYITWKIQFAVGAGKDRFKEVFEIKEIRKDNGEIDYKKLYEAEREKAQKARRNLEFTEKENKKLKSENKRIRLENDDLNKQLQKEKREHSGTQALLRKDITIMQRLLEFSEKVKKSRFGRFFFRKDIELLDESKEIHNDKDER